MAFTGFADEAFMFYEGLRADNSKTYWTAHKQTYDTAVRAPMQALLDELAPAFDAMSMMFRPYRDIRFSKDKSPYKIHQGALLEVVPSVGYYLQLNADGVVVGAGFHPHDRTHIARYRAAVDAETTGKALAEIVTRLEKANYEIGGHQVRTRPRGVAAEHPRLDLMRREFITATHNVDPEEASGKSFASSVKKDWQRMRPLVDWVLTNAPPNP